MGCVCVTSWVWDVVNAYWMPCPGCSEGIDYESISLKKIPKKNDITTVTQTLVTSRLDVYNIFYEGLKKCCIVLH